MPESSLVGSFTMLVRPYSLTISSNLLCFVAVCWFVVQRFSQLMSGSRQRVRLTVEAYKNGRGWPGIHVGLPVMLYDH